MEKFTRLTTQAVPLPFNDVDTDQIIPARFLKTLTRTGLGNHLFADWRYEVDGSIQPDFVLNDSAYRGQVLIAGHNFGCGSSREHAAWALQDYGFRVVISSGFADIFKENALNNGLLPIEVDADTLQALFMTVKGRPETRLTIDLDAEELTLDSWEQMISIQVPVFRKVCLQEGYDLTDYLVRLSDHINAYERKTELITQKG